MKVEIRYLIELSPGRNGLPRYYWFPKYTQGQSIRGRRVPFNWREFTDPQRLVEAAAAEVAVLNRELDARIDAFWASRGAEAAALAERFRKCVKMAGTTIRAAGRAAGLDTATTHRLSHGKPVSEKNAAAILAWIEAREQGGSE